MLPLHRRSGLLVRTVFLCNFDDLTISWNKINIKNSFSQLFMI